MRCLVVGAGIVGICSALQLQREGHEVVVIDRNGPGEATSRGNAGIFAIGHVVPIGTPAILKRVPAMLLDSTSPLTIRRSYMARYCAVADPPCSPPARRAGSRRSRMRSPRSSRRLWRAIGR